jgi:ubiquinone/menaquinone biosynthesis C-methylase UbiE
MTIHNPIPTAFSGDIPKNYDTFLGPMFFEPFATEMALRIKKIGFNKILELACGTGRLTKLLPGLADDKAQIVASDINAAMINYGREKISSSLLEWMVIDAVSLPFEDNTFDCIAVQFGVMFYSDKIQAFKEAFRVLKPGGTLIFTSWNHIEANPMANIVNEVLQEFFPVDTPAFYSVPFSYFDIKKMHANLQYAGFNDIDIELLNLKGKSQSASEAAKGLIEGTPTVTAIEERNPEKLPALMKRLEQLISTKFGLHELQIPLQAFVVTAIKPKP